MASRAHRHVAILAGGKGTRFWPVGRLSRPKQVIPLDGDDPRPLVRAAWERSAPLCHEGTPWVVASRAIAPVLRRILPAAARRRLLLEPEPRNTAAAVAWAAVEVAARDPEGVVAVVPSDHHVSPDAAWRRAIASLLDRAAEVDRILTLGLRPAFPATGYGYLETGERRAQTPAGPVHAVRRYVEKPARPAANRFVRSGRFLWNLGTFAFRPRVFLDAMAAHFPEGARALQPLLSGPRTPRSLAAAYRAVPSTSVDYAVMEKCGDLEVVAAAFDWDDLGSWDAVARHAAPDAGGNLMHPRHVAVDAGDCFVRAEDGTTVALLGVSDLIVVRTKDALLVARRGRGEDVRRVYEALRDGRREDLLR
jgi:mannose-1-phosphate guanylyltransferase